MKIVYIIQSIEHCDKHYIGITEDAEKRLKSHNYGQSAHTR